MPGSSGGGIPGNGGCVGLAFWRFLPGGGLAIHNHAPESSSVARLLTSWSSQRRATPNGRWAPIRSRVEVAFHRAPRVTRTGVRPSGIWH